MGGVPEEKLFRIIVHERERIIEVRYPAHPSRAALEKYAEEIRATVKRVGTSWRCLADQSALTVMPPELTPIISELNHWALEHGMERTARVVKRSAISEMQARRIIREGGLVQNAGIYDTRDEAWRALTEEQGAKSTGS